ncbi:hypothetical protein ACO11K_003005 [Bacillus cytotoxicus]
MEWFLNNWSGILISGVFFVLSLITGQKVKESIKKSNNFNQKNSNGRNLVQGNLMIKGDLSQNYTDNSKKIHNEYQNRVTYIVPKKKEDEQDHILLFIVGGIVISIMTSLFVIFESIALNSLLTYIICMMAIVVGGYIPIIIDRSWKMNVINLTHMIFPWSGILLIIYVMKNPLYQSNNLLSVKEYIKGGGYDGIISRFYTSFSNYPSEITFLVFQSLALGILVVLCLWTTYIQMSTVTKTIEKKMWKSNTRFKVLSWINKYLLKGEANLNTLVGQALILAFGVGLGCGAITLLLY